METKNLFEIVSLTLILSSSTVALSGTESGGGGDSSEARVDDIREDILSWINRGGADDLTFSGSQTLADYKEGMRTILTPQYVIIGFVEKDDANNDELKVSVNGRPKTCRGFIARTDRRPHILCNISRFNHTTQADQYSLVHHEYAGLAGLEKNEGAASDYTLSSQITDYLTPQTILKLAVIAPSEPQNIDNISYYSFWNDHTMVCKIHTGSSIITKDNLLESLQVADINWPIIPTNIPYQQRRQAGYRDVFPEYKEKQSDFDMKYIKEINQLKVKLFNWQWDGEYEFAFDMNSMINVKKIQNETQATYIATTNRTNAEILNYDWRNISNPEKLVIQISPGEIHLKHGFRFVGGSSRGSIINFSYGVTTIDCHSRSYYKGKQFIENELTEFWNVVP